MAPETNMGKYVGEGTCLQPCSKMSYLGRDHPKHLLKASLLLDRRLQALVYAALPEVPTKISKFSQISAMVPAVQ